MPEVLNPVSIEEAIRDCANRIANGVFTVPCRNAAAWRLLLRPCGCPAPEVLYACNECLQEHYRIVAGHLAAGDAVTHKPCGHCWGLGVDPVRHVSPLRGQS